MLNPFCGCGTTLAVAERTGRRWIGIDISVTAMGIIERRILKERGTPPKVIGMPTTESELAQLKPFEFQNWVIRSLQGTHSPGAPVTWALTATPSFDRDPIQDKRSERVGRPVVDSFETAIEREGKHHGVIVAFGFTLGAKEEIARVRAAKGLDIELVTVREILIARGELRIPDLGDIFPKPLQAPSFMDLPLLKSRSKAQKPSVSKLIASARARARGAGLAESRRCVATSSC